MKYLFILCYEVNYFKFKTATTKESMRWAKKFLALGRNLRKHKTTLFRRIFATNVQYDITLPYTHFNVANMKVLLVQCNFKTKISTTCVLLYKNKKPSCRQDNRPYTALQTKLRPI